MVRRWSVLGTVGWFTVAATAMPGDDPKKSTPDLPAASEVLDRHVAATGGEDAHRRVESRRTTGRLVIDLAGHHLEARVVKQQLAPGKSHQLLDGDHLSSVTVCDGEHAWEWSPGHGHGDEEGVGETELLTGAKAAWTREQGSLRGAVGWRDHYDAVETVGVVDRDGRPAFEVRLTAPCGETHSRFFDRETGRQVGYRRTVATGYDNEVVVDAALEGYREFDGVWLPTRVRQTLHSKRFGEGTQLWTYDGVEHDVKIPASLFKMPDEVRDQLGTDL